ncbi:hypothetical protein PRIC2_006324 [Phytophthora ramorum]
MAASPPFCFRLEATRGPHSDATHRYCWQEHPPSPSSSSAVRLLSIGRKKRCWLRLTKDLEVSSFHAELRFLGDGDGSIRLVLRDIKSTNGTKLNGEPLRPQQDYQLSSGDLIGVGRTSLRFVKVKHSQPCGDEEEYAANAATCTAVLTSSASSSMAPAAAPEEIELDESSTEEIEAPALPASTSAGPKAVTAVVGSKDIPRDQPDIEPAHEEGQKPVKDAVGHKAVKDGVGADKGKEGGDNVVLGLVQKAKATKKGWGRTGGVDEFTPEDATCTICTAMIGQLDMLEQQAHLNECLGGRVATRSADTSVTTALSTTATKDAKPKSRKRGNAGGGVARTKRPRKPKASEGDPAPKAIKMRKRKRAGDGEDIELSLALAPTSKVSKEQQTDMQLAVAKTKLEDLDVQMAKLAKRRANLVKTLDRLGRTKEKLRKSQVLPPAKVPKFLDLAAALAAIFPSSRQAHADQRESMEDERNVSFVAKRYTPSRWIESEVAIDCEDEKQAELATVAAISMWARASQQLFGLQRDTLLYRNSVLRAFLGDDEDVDISSIEMDSADDMGNEGADVVRGEESEAEALLPPVAPDATADQQSDWTPGVEEVPDVVKCVFPNWQQDLAFLQEQTAEELEMALEAMHAAVKQADDAEANLGENIRATAIEEPIAGEPSVAPSKCSPPIRGDQQLACEYMAQIMTRLIDEKRRPTDPASLSNGQEVVDLAGFSNDNDRPQRDASTVSNNGAGAKPYDPEELPTVRNAELVIDQPTHQDATSPV